MKEWIRQLKISLASSKGTSQNLKIVGSKFWKGTYIREEDLLNEAQTGDVILFRSKSFNSRMQRSLTRSYYGRMGVHTTRPCRNADALQRSRTLLIRGDVE